MNKDPQHSQEYSPFNDPRPNAPDNWYQPSSIRSDPTPPDGYWGTEPPPSAAPVNRMNDTGYDPTLNYEDIPPEADIDGLHSSGVDPNLADVRSTNVSDPHASFWEKGKKNATGNVSTPPASQTGLSGPLPSTEKKLPLRSIIFSIIAFVCVVLIALTWIQLEFRIREIHVGGTLKNYTKEQIVSIAGVKPGDNAVFTKLEVERKLNKQTWLHVISTSFRDHVYYIEVFEREPIAYTDYGGEYYLVDMRGMVLEKVAKKSIPDHLVGLPFLNLHSCHPGMHLDTTSPETFNTIYYLLREIHIMGLQDMLSSVTLTNLEAITGETRDGYFIRLGTNAYLHEKLRALTLVHDNLVRIGRVGGTIDVTNAAKPSYKPPEE